MKTSVNQEYYQTMNFLGKLIEYLDDFDAILRDVAMHYDADRAYIFEFSEDRTTTSNTYEWCRSGVRPEIDNLQNLPYESVAVWVEEFERVGAFSISSLDQDVDTRSLTYEILEPQGIESLITAPIYRDHVIIGFVGVDNPRANKDDVIILQTTASIIYGEISRKIVSQSKTIQKMADEQLRQNDIIASANMGTWRIELVENEEPRMYVDDTMKRLLGTEGQERSPESTYNDWFSNITPAALASVLNSVARMEQGFFDENTYLWKHPTKGVRYVRCGGTAKEIPGGFSLQGYHYDVDEVVRKELKQMHLLQKALEDKKEYYDSLSAMGDIFYSMHMIDLVKDTVSPISARDAVKEIVNRKNGAADMMRETMQTLVTEEYRDWALEFTDLTTLSGRMQNKKIISREFVGKNIGWFVASFITMDADEEGKPSRVLFATRDIEEEKKQVLTDEMTGLLNRRAYEEKIYEHNEAPEEDSFVYVSLDANGLKVVNDTLGHEAGDELLIGVAQCMRRSLGRYGYLYRIGGDEYVAILFCDDEEAKKAFAEFDDAIATWKGKIVDHLSVSYGWTSKQEMPGASTRELGAVAEQRMYEAKSNYYRKQGVDRRGQQDAHKALCSLYTKILRINITEDNYQIVNMDETEQTEEKGYATKISEWLTSFGKTGQVHPDDLAEYLCLTDLAYMKEYFAGNKTSLHIFYRRKMADGYRKVMMEIIPTDDFTLEDMSLFLYVKDIDK